MRNIKLTIAYDGTAYCGWQIQPNGLTVQEVLQNAVREMAGENANVIGAGRTDAGVHALGQVASFKTESDIPPDGFLKGLNTKLPRDIRVLSVHEVPVSFHPMRDAKSKHYRYIMTAAEHEHPLHLNRAWCIGCELDIESMRRAADFLVGRHDFSAFRASDGGDEGAVREIYSVSLQGEYTIDIIGGGFLKNMVRNIVGTLADVGLGKTTPEEFKSILESKDRKKAGICAPASGLYLVSVGY